jgi:hypothetical protein
MNSQSRLVYTTDWTTKTVTIDYNKTLKQFLSQKEQLPFTAEKIIRMLDWWAQKNRVGVTLVGQLHIATSEAHCILTQHALNTLSVLYRQRRDWQIEYPFVSGVLAM